jgi:hypothetical protein
VICYGTNAASQTVSAWPTARRPPAAAVAAAPGEGGSATGKPEVISCVDELEPLNLQPQV